MSPETRQNRISSENQTDFTAGMEYIRSLGAEQAFPALADAARTHLKEAIREGRDPIECIKIDAIESTPDRKMRLHGARARTYSVLKAFKPLVKKCLEEAINDSLANFHSEMPRVRTMEERLKFLKAHAKHVFMLYSEILLEQTLTQEEYPWLPDNCETLTDLAETLKSKGHLIDLVTDLAQIDFGYNTASALIISTVSTLPIVFYSQFQRIPTVEEIQDILGNSIAMFRALSGLSIYDNSMLDSIYLRTRNGAHLLDPSFLVIGENAKGNLSLGLRFSTIKDVIKPYTERNGARKNDNLSLSEELTQGHPPIGCPFGKLARLVLQFYIDNAETIFQDIDEDDFKSYALTIFIAKNGMPPIETLNRIAEDIRTSVEQALKRAE